MKKIREVLRLRYTQKLSCAQIGKSCNLSQECVRCYLKRALKAGVSWPLPEGLSDIDLEGMLFKKHPVGTPKPLPDLPAIHQALKKKGVTLVLLWEEYKELHPDGLEYSRFCDHYRLFKSKLQPTMRMMHVAGEKLFVDFAGMKLPWIERLTGEIHEAEIFVAVLGASNYTYVEALPDQSLPCWIEAHVRTFEFIGGVTESVVPDNLKAGVTKAHYYDPDVNGSYQDFACHYSVAILPTRPNHPRDKAKVEVGVQGVERRILAPLRDRTFWSIAEINEALAPLIEAYNKRPFKDLPGSRTLQFIDIEKPALRPLPAVRYQYAQWKQAKVHLDYHVAFEKHFYSVPHSYIGEVITLRVTRTTVECYVGGQRIACHIRSYNPGSHTTVREHMPKAHQSHEDWTIERLTAWARQIGPATADLLESVIRSRAFPQQGIRTCLGILRLSKSYGAGRLEEAAKRALAIGATRYLSIESILKRGLDHCPVQGEPSRIKAPPLPHINVRGANYYHSPITKGGSVC